MTVNYDAYFESVINGLDLNSNLRFYKASTFPTINPIYWLVSHFAVGAYSPIERLSGMLTAHMTQIAPRNGFRWHPHRGLEIYTYVIEGELYHEDTTGGNGVITAGEVQRMYSGDYIEHQELNLTDAYTRVIQIWFLVPREQRGLPPQYEQVKLTDMPAATIGDGVVREIIGPSRVTDSHVKARLTNTIMPPGGQSRVQLPQPGEDLFLYITDGAGHIQSDTLDAEVGLYDVLLATPNAEAPVLTAGDKPLNYLSFYLDSFLGVNGG
jgi:hypothetical protein